MLKSRGRLVLAISLYICRFWPSFIRPILWISWRVNKLRAHWDYMNIISTLWFLTDASTSYCGHQRVLCLHQWKKLGLALNPSAWFSCLVRWSTMLAHDSLPLHGARPTACSLVTIHVLVINFPFMIQHNHLMWLISWLTFSISNFSESAVGAPQASVSLSPTSKTAGNNLV